MIRRAGDGTAEGQEIARYYLSFPADQLAARIADLYRRWDRLFCRYWRVPQDTPSERRLRAALAAVEAAQERFWYWLWQGMSADYADGMAGRIHAEGVPWHRLPLWVQPDGLATRATGEDDRPRQWAAAPAGRRTRAPIWSD